VRIARPELDAWTRNPEMQIHPTVFDANDGVPGHQFPSGYSPMVAKSRDGRIWFVPVGGVSVIDPARLAFNALPPPVHIEQLVVDGKTYSPAAGVRLPPRVRDVSIDYTALSLVAPEKVRFRYMLEGQDRDWKEVINDRQVQYSNLPPGRFRFRVVAANNSGVWNEEGATLEFSIAAAYYQTSLFRAIALGIGLAMVWAVYRARVRQIARAYQRRLDERVDERTRIARELHDTLLQSFHGLLLRFQTASVLLPDRPAEAKQQLDTAIARASAAISEGRDAVQGLRASTVERNELAVAIRMLGDELATDATSDKPSHVSVHVEGTPRDLHPIVRDEIYKIAAEALRNVFRHAHASHVEVELHYDDEQLRLRVRDDGKGIDPKVLASEGREGHYGLRGMPERAALIKGRLAVWSEVGTGTEVELRVPGSLVYARLARRRWWSRLLDPS
jgi:signal transduction histidine kinase